MSAVLGGDTSLLRPSRPPRPRRQKRWSDEAILAAAEAILWRRTKRLGSVTDARSMAGFLRVRLAPLEHEEFHAIFLDARMRVRSIEMLARGGAHSAEVSVGQVVKRALQQNASAVVVSHNHPSGNPEPSLSDIALTRSLHAALKLVDIRLLDHLVVGVEGYASIAERGLV